MVSEMTKRVGGMNELNEHISSEGKHLLVTNLQQAILKRMSLCHAIWQWVIKQFNSKKV
jgi:hypothetical protein